MKTRLQHLTEILEQQRGKVIACEIDLIVYNRKLIVVKDQNALNYFNKKVEEIKAVKARAEETVNVIEKLIIDEGKKGSKKQSN
jgi:hypothetical protein